MSFDGMSDADAQPTRTLEFLEELSEFADGWEEVESDAIPATQSSTSKADEQALLFSAQNEVSAPDGGFLATTELSSHLQSEFPSGFEVGGAVSEDSAPQPAERGGRPHNLVLRSPEPRPLTVAGTNVPSQQETAADPATQTRPDDSIVLAERPRARPGQKTPLSFAMKVTPEGGSATVQFLPRRIVGRPIFIGGDKAAMTGQDPVQPSAGDESASPGNRLFEVNTVRRAEGRAGPGPTPGETMPPAQPRQRSAAQEAEGVSQRDFGTGTRLGKGTKARSAPSIDGDRHGPDLASSAERERGDARATISADHEAGELTPGRSVSGTHPIPMTTPLGGARNYVPGGDNSPMSRVPVKPTVLPATSEQFPVPASAVRQIDLKLSGMNNQEVSMRVVERAGKVHVAVRTPGTDLASALRQDLDGLVNNIEQQGLRAETWKPNEGPAQLGLEVLGSGAGVANEGYKEGSEGGRHPGENQQRGGRQRPNWLDELGLEGQTSEEIDEEVAEWLRTWQA